MKTFLELNIKKWEYDALIKVRDKLATSVFAYEGDFWENNEEGRGLLFNMNYTARTRTAWTDADDDQEEEYACGTVCCIGGWVKIENEGWKPNAKGLIELTAEMQDSVDNYVDQDYGSPLRALYYPPDRLDYDAIKPSHAVQAIDNFLNYGDPMWDDIIPYEEY